MLEVGDNPYINVLLLVFKKNCLLGVTFINLSLRASVFLKLITRVVKKKVREGFFASVSTSEDGTQL
jgi:hypothetical protein